MTRKHLHYLQMRVARPMVLLSFVLTQWFLGNCWAATHQAQSGNTVLSFKDFDNNGTFMPNTDPSSPFWGINIGARGVIAYSLLGANLAPAQEIFPTNAALFALYNISTHHSIGVEFGQESFFQRFFYTDVRGVEYRVEQHPTLLWGGLAYRFMLLPEQTFSPFAHIVLGATQVSAMGRGMIGLTYKPDARTQFLLGAEASNLFFQSNSMLYMAPKLGVSYGVSITF